MTHNTNIHVKSLKYILFLISNYFPSAISQSSSGSIFINFVSFIRIPIQLPQKLWTFSIQTNSRIGMKGTGISESIH